MHICSNTYMYVHVYMYVAIYSRHLLKQCRLFKISKPQNKKVEICIGVFSMCPKIQISEKSRFSKNVPHSYQLRLGYIYIYAYPNMNSAGN